jgi:rhodanese-related sulfurtransferase
MELPAINPEEAKKLLDSDSSYVYLDVRTPAEFQAGRPTGAINIPVAEMNPVSGSMELNPKFMDVVTAHIGKEAKVIVGCRSGARSAAAQELMHQAGYTDTSNMLGGFGGKSDATGQVITEGWSTLGYPTERGDAGDAGYAALSTKTTP